MTNHVVAQCPTVRQPGFNQLCCPWIIVSCSYTKQKDFDFDFNTELLGHSELQVGSDVEVTHIVTDCLLAIWT